MYHVYIIHSKSKDRYYVGYTHDISTRIGKHNMGSTPSTRSGIPWELVYQEEYAEKSMAIKREKEIKSQKSRQYFERLINASRD